MRRALISQAARLRREHTAATAVEYALLGSLVAGAAMAGMVALGLSLDVLFTNVSDRFAAQTPVDPPRCIQVGSQCPK